jgi:hypothetical protein
MSAALGLRLERANNDALDLLVSDAPLHSWPGLIVESFHPLLDEALAPLCDGYVRTPQFAGNVSIRHPRCASQDDARSKRQVPVRSTPLRESLQHGVLISVDYQLRLGSSCPGHEAT